MTALHVATSNGHVEVVKALLGGGADLEGRNEVGGMGVLNTGGRRNEGAGMGQSGGQAGRGWWCTRG